MRRPVRVIEYGLGPIGCAAARLIDERDNLELVGAVDIDPEKVGREAGEVIGISRSMGFEVQGKLADVVAEADVVVHPADHPHRERAEVRRLDYGLVAYFWRIC